MNNGGMTRAEAYDKARKEFYALRQEEEVERRVAREEALWVGAYFGKSVLEVSNELEDKTYEDSICGELGESEDVKPEWRSPSTVGTL